jgi:hypothetical protein
MFEPGDMVEYVKFGDSSPELYPEGTIGIVKSQAMPGSRFYHVIFWFRPHLTVSVWHKDLRLVKGEPDASR